MRFGILGPLAVWTSDGSIVRVPEMKVRALLADLLVQDGRLVSAERLADDLWQGNLPGNAANTLQTKVSQLRRALEEAEPGGRSLVVYRRPGYVLQVEPEAVDAHRFHQLTARARETVGARERAALLSESLGLWRGPALADFQDEEFARVAIARLEEQRLAALEELAEARLELGQHSVLAGELAELVARHPLREGLRAAHLRALYGAGRQSEALDSYAQLRDRLSEELGLDPSRELVALHEAILKQDPALRVVPVPQTAMPRARTNVSTPLTDLIGRTDTLARVCATLANHRLVTLSGPGGVGKTRLAIEMALELADRFADGAWLVELTGLSDSTSPGSPISSADVAEAVTAVLGVRDDAQSDVPAGGEPVVLANRLINALRSKQMLLVLDNCERASEPIAELAEQMLTAAPGLRILATSQVPLGVAGEVLWTVPALELPDLTANTPEAIQNCSAARLFVMRASATAPGFTLDADNAHAIATICRRLDGIPLALELAANRVRALGVHELAARLDDRFRLLTSGRLRAPARQHTLRATIDWSWDLLPQPERIVLRRLSVHVEGCTLEAAETVCSGEGVGTHEVLDTLARLVDRSLVVVANHGGLTRYRLLESVAAYGSERLREAGEFEHVLQHHGHYYTDFAERAESHLRGHDQREWLERLDAETANLRRALDNARQRGDADLALRLVNTMAWYWFLRGRLTEARRSMDAALAIGGETEIAARARAVAWLAGIRLLGGYSAHAAEPARSAWKSGDVDDLKDQAMTEWFIGFAESDHGDPSASEELVERALATFRAQGHAWGVAAALSTRAKHAAVRGDLSALECNAVQSLELFQGLGDQWGQLQATEWLGELAELTGEYEQASRLHQEGLRMAEDLGLWPQAADRLSWLGRTALLIGEYPQARELFERAMRLAGEHAYKPGEIFAEIGLGLVARREGNLSLAETHLRNVLEWHHRMSHGPGVSHAIALAELGFIAEQRGDADTSRSLHLESFAAARGLGDRRAVAVALVGLAGAQALANRHTDAARLLGAAAAARESASVPLPGTEMRDIQRISETARARLGATTFGAEFASGSRLAPDEAHSTIVPPPASATSP